LQFPTGGEIWQRWLSAAKLLTKDEARRIALAQTGLSPKP
jgi:hypothetical protein